MTDLYLHQSMEAKMNFNKEWKALDPKRIYDGL